MRILVRTLQIATVAISSATAALTEPLPARELVERCEAFSQDPSSVSGGLCDSYIRGFLAGLFVEALVRIASDTESRETFAERAARTRIGMRLESTRNPHVCLAEGTSMDRLVQRLITHGGQRELDGVTASDLLHRMLTSGYPCER